MMTQAITPPSALMIPATSPARRIWAMSIQAGMAMSAAGDMVGRADKMTVPP